MSEPLPPIDFLPRQRRRRWWARAVWALPLVFLAIGAAGLVMISRGAIVRIWP